MANSTINGLSEVTTLATNDQFVVWATSANGTRKVKGENLDKLIFRQRSAATDPSGKIVPIVSYAGGVPVVEGITFENFTAPLNQGIADGAVTSAKIADGAVTSAKLAPSVRVNDWAKKTANYTAISCDRIAADTTAGAFTITLPASPAALDWVLISDIAQKWGTNNLTVARNNSLINGLAENLVCDTTGEILLRYEGTTQGWRVFAYGY
jgi:hypothetical protein